jgi:hypothetical protein
MSNNFLRAGNLDEDAVVDLVKGKVRFENVLTGLGNPTDPPSVPEKSWVYYDVTDDLAAVGYVWDPDGEAWCLMSASGSGTGMAWSPVQVAVADDVTVTMAQPGAAYVVPRTSGENRAIFDCSALLASPGVPTLIIGASVTETTGTQTTYGPSVYVPVSQPGWLADLTSLLGAITITDYTASPVDLVFTAPAVTITLDADYATSLGVLLEIVAQFAGTTAVSGPTIIQDITGTSFTSALRTVAVGDAAVFTFNAGGSTAGELTDWFTADATYIDGWTDYPVGLGGVNVGTGSLGALSTTHLWTDDRAMDYAHASELVSVDGETIQASCYKFRPETLSFAPADAGDWPEHDFGDTPADFNVAQALNILAARSGGWKEDIVRSNTSGTSVAVGAAAGTGGVASLILTPNDASGGVAVTTEADATSGDVATVTFATPFPGAATVMIAPADPQAAALAGVYAVIDGLPAASFTIHSTLALPASTELEWVYHVIGQPD